MINGIREFREFSRILKGFCIGRLFRHGFSDGRWFSEEGYRCRVYCRNGLRGQIGCVATKQPSRHSGPGGEWQNFRVCNRRPFHYSRGKTQMALHPNFPKSPYAPLIPEQRWFPEDETLRATASEKLLPPLVAKIRTEVFAWRNKGYAGASPTSASLLRHWFETEHLEENVDGSLSTFRYYFAQREAVETVIWLHEVRRARDKFDLLRFDASGAVSTGMFDEDWPRYVLKMATGAGKTKVLSLLIAWCFFHKLYEPDSPLARNFLVIAPNIIVLDRLRADFDGLKIFFNDPVFPDNGYEGRNWRDDFQVTLHIQDDVCIIRETGNFFLTNIHRVFLGDVRDPSLEDDDLRDYFLAPFGAKPAGKTTDSKTDLGEIVREISEPDAGKILYDSFKTAINALTIEEAGTTRIEDRIRLREMRPFRTEHRPYLEAG